MDQVTLKRLYADVASAAEWLRGDRPGLEDGQQMAADFFGVGVVVARHQLSRAQVDELLHYMQELRNRAIEDRERDAFWSEVIGRAICPN